jgi:hypothetical protein
MVCREAEGDVAVDDARVGAGALIGCGAGRRHGPSRTPDSTAHAGPSFL